MEYAIEKTLIPRWRSALLAVVLLAVLALVVSACAPAVSPEEAAVEETTAPTEAAAPDTGEMEEAVDQDVADTEASDSLVDFFAADGEPTGEYNGVPVGLTVSGLPYRGDPNAPVVLVEYSDYQCPFCGRHFVQTEPAITEQYVDEGLVRAVFVEFPLRQLHPIAPTVHAAALCVLDQGSVENYWEMHRLLFTTEDEWGATPDPQPVLERLAEEAGADLDAFVDCMESGEKLAEVDEWVSFAMEQGFGGTPSFQLIRVEDGASSQIVGAQPFDAFDAQIDLLLSGGTPEAAQSPEAEIPFWATEEGWEPDPDRPGFNMAGDQYKGELDAPIKIVEFSDFQCPYCRQHALETQPVLDENYVDTGDVMWIFKHFPLEDIHPAAPMASAAAECATGQEMFWEYAHMIFERQDDWATGDTEAVLLEIADELGMDTDILSACMADDAIAAAVNEDLVAGAPFVRGTPAFIVLRGEEGSIIPGALPAESFTQILDEILAEVEAE